MLETLESASEQLAGIGKAVDREMFQDLKKLAEEIEGVKTVAP